MYFLIIITGIGLSVLNPASVVLTDMLEVVPLIQANIQLNGYTSDSVDVRHCLSACYSAETLFWGEQPSHKVLSCNLIVASDVVYDPIGYEPLIDSVVSILRHSTINVDTLVTENLLQSTRTSSSTSSNEDGSSSSSSSRNDSLCILAHRHRHPEDAKYAIVIFVAVCSYL